MIAEIRKFYGQVARPASKSSSSYIRSFEAHNNANLEDTLDWGRRDSKWIRVSKKTVQPMLKELSRAYHRTLINPLLGISMSERFLHLRHSVSEDSHCHKCTGRPVKVGCML